MIYRYIAREASRYHFLPRVGLRTPSESRLYKSVKDLNYTYPINARFISIRPKISTQAKPEELNVQEVPYKALKPITPNDLYVSCTTFDKKGNITGVSQKYLKMDFLKQNFLFPRDLRKIDTSSVDVIPSIMIRPPTSILVNLLHIKAIIKKDSVMIFDTSTPSIAKKLGIFMYDLELKLKLPSDIPYEFKALESILISVMSYLESELYQHRRTCGRILTELEDQIDRKKLQDLLIKLKKLSSFYQKSILIKNVLEELLDNDEDLEGMYLTSIKSNVDDYQEIEMILESYYNQCDEIVQQAGSLLNDIKVTEEIINIILDTNRNSLMLFELKITVYTLGFTVATLLPAFYGMNLKNYIEESNWGFGMVVVISIIQGLIITFINFRKLKIVQKLTMGDSFRTNGMRSLGGHSRHSRDKWWYKLIYGSRNTKYHPPSLKDKDVIWRMINDDKPLK
ncbi:mitochondrial magnesium ion transporter [Suhomyces tanzawaensis NRRL Y-17324]|uniref:Magnesium transporter n=1 Tax=Suhomyces tanzawaensis NRRL Y-17324 TaxID=984487 RepID=A0A1E4SRR5_9ASCO|nr:mitochondrial magnesium ion transporter [Suhomyces tanzawaensis NRRL Y-17324]ODV82200.1 mitochondrial magnesium ion transporter [Suhomyces tanzawaensis NRRL Y-17324]